jgi:hypothetical protein
LRTANNKEKAVTIIYTNKRFIALEDLARRRNYLACATDGSSDKSLTVGSIQNTKNIP